MHSKAELKFTTRDPGVRFCDDRWNMVNSNVVCRSLGYTAATDYSTDANKFGEGTGDIILDNVQCVGTETNIAFCPHVGYGNHNCGHGEDVGVICAGKY